MYNVKNKLYYTKKDIKYFFRNFIKTPLRFMFSRALMALIQCLPTEVFWLIGSGNLWCVFYDIYDVFYDPYDAFMIYMIYLWYLWCDAQEGDGSCWYEMWCIYTWVSHYFISGIFVMLFLGLYDVFYDAIYDVFMMWCMMFYDMFYGVFMMCFMIYDVLWCMMFYDMFNEVWCVYDMFYDVWCVYDELHNMFVETYGREWRVWRNEFRIAWSAE